MYYIDLSLFFKTVLNVLLKKWIELSKYSHLNDSSFVLTLSDLN